MHQGPLDFSGHDFSAKEEDPYSEDWAWKGLYRGLLWRLKLGVLPSSSPCVEELRRAAADSRRKYAELRRRVLVDPHAMEVSQNPRTLSMDNPLSQEPDSVWSRHFQISELEETIDKDLSRLYPEHGDFFQRTICQAMLRRILLIWSLMHPSCSYQQGMHELLAPLLYVLLCDVSIFSEVKQRYVDVFDDRFEELSCLEPRRHENGVKQMNKKSVCYKAVTISEDSQSAVDLSLLEKISGHTCASLQVDEWNYGVSILVMGNDTYGTEGELGVLFSERFVEHDAFFMFNALMHGKSGGVDMADYFLPPNSTGVSPALEASNLLYKALAFVDKPLLNHLKGLGVEPQFFSLRWIRVLLGREFDLQTLLIIWDALLSRADFYDTYMLEEDFIECLPTPRRVFIIAFALSMLLYLRLTLLAAPEATTVLQKLLNFPQTASIDVLIEGARLLCPLVKEIACSCTTRVPNMDTDTNGMVGKSSCSSLSHLNTTKFSPEMLQKSVPDFYWEEKWKSFVLRKDTQHDSEANQGSAFAEGIEHLLGSGNTSTRGAKKGMMCARPVKRSGGEILPYESSTIHGATRHCTGKVEKSIQQTVTLVADNSNHGGLKTSRLEIIGESILAGATAFPVSNLPKTPDSSDDCKASRSMLTTHGYLQSLGCNKENHSLPESLSTDKGSKSLLSHHWARVDAASRSLLTKSPLPPWKSWIWSFGRSRGQCKGVDKKVPSHIETSKASCEAAAIFSADETHMLDKESPLPKSKESGLINHYATRQGTDCSSEQKDQGVMDCPSVGEVNDEVPSMAKYMEEASHSTSFRRLGLFMSNEIQVIEHAVARILTSEIAKGAIENCTDVHSSRMAKIGTEANTGEYVPNAVQRAIGELKNVSSKLFQM